MFSRAQSDTFQLDGFVRLPGAVPAAVAADMKDRLWSLLEEKGARRADPTTWEARYASRLHAIQRGDPDPNSCGALREALDAVFGGHAWQMKSHWGQSLVTFPTTDPWALPKSPWHLDHPYHQTHPISGVNLFLFVDDVAPRGGGTVVVRSSPRLVGRFVSGIERVWSQKSRDVKRRFHQTHPWLLELTGKPMLPDRNDRLMAQDTDIDGIPTRVVELTGRAGDVVLCHPWLVHAIARNTSPRPRMMRASRVYSREFRDRYLRGAGKAWD